MRKGFYLCINGRTIFISYKTDAQNLLLNGSFENPLCPTTTNFNVPPWTDPTSSTPDYFNECGGSVPYNFGGYQYPKGGEAYIGINTYLKSFFFRSYVQSILTDTLIAGATYCISFYVSCADTVNYAVASIGAYVSKTAITCGSPGCLLNFIPQVSNPTGNIITDTANWTRINGSFVAAGGEKYITIGNFKNDINSDTIRINTKNNQDDSYYFVDSVTLMLCSDTSNAIKEINNDIKIKLFPNPSNGTIILNYTIKQNDVAAIKIYDLRGKLVEEYELNSNKNELQLNTNLNNGIYLYQIIVNNRIVKGDKLVVIK